MTSHPSVLTPGRSAAAGAPPTRPQGEGAFDSARLETLIAKYGERVPRYTSYPTAPHFKPEVGPEVYAEWLAALDPAEPISAYIHVPFCASLCWYCGCHMSVVRSHEPVIDYVDRLAEEFQLVARHLKAPLTIKALHFGGGTPNILKPRDLDVIFTALRDTFRLDPAAEIAAEMDPRTLTPEWIEAAASHGLSRASLGVQDIDPEVQRSVNRVQPLQQTAWCAAALRDAGVGSINVDLMYGLPHQTEASVAATVREVLTLAPDRIALFGYAHVPWMKPAQRLLPEAAMPGALSRFRQQETAAQVLVDAGYIRIGLDHFARGDDDLATDHVRRNFQGYTSDNISTLLGFGASSIGKLPQGYVQNIARTHDWRASVKDGRLPTARGIALSEDDRFRAALIERLMCDLRVDVREVAAQFGFGSEAVADGMARLGVFENEGLLKVDGPRLTVTEDGRPFVRSICAVFDRYLVQSAGKHSAGV